MFYYSTSSTVYNIIYTSYQLRFPFSLCHHSFYPMSSINHPKNSGQKTVFFHSFLAPKSPLNHYMLWSNPIISPLNHNTSSELYSQRAPFVETYPLHKPFPPYILYPAEPPNLVLEKSVYRKYIQYGQPHNQ